MREASGHGVAGAGPEATVGSGIQPVTRTTRLDVAACEGHEVATVADDDGVVREAGQELAVDAGRVDRVGIAGQVGGIRSDGRLGALTQATRPLLHVEGITDLLGETEEEGGEVARGARGQLAVAGELAG